MLRWENKEIDYLKLNFDNKTNQELSNYLNRTPASINKKLNLLNLKRNKSNYREYETRTINFLLEENLESYYWSGFILADGCYYNNRIILKISKKDEHHLKVFCNRINAKYNYYSYNTNFIDNQKIISVTFRNKNIVPLICSKFDIKPRKTYNPPDFSKYNFTDDQMLSLIIGFIDGDGTIYNKKDRGKIRPSISIQLHKNWLFNLNFMNNHIHKIFNISKLPNISMNKRGHISLSLNKFELLKNIKEFGTKNDLPLLSRKWDHILSIL